MFLFEFDDLVSMSDLKLDHRNLTVLVDEHDQHHHAGWPEWTAQPKIECNIHFAGQELVNHLTCNLPFPAHSRMPYALAWHAPFQGYNYALHGADSSSGDRWAAHTFPPLAFKLQSSAEPQTHKCENINAPRCVGHSLRLRRRHVDST